MKLKLPSQVIESSTPFATEEFDIGDKAVVLDILRGKMYSNPIHTIAQEIMSNARDAHREVGREDIPIIVTIPTTLDPAFKIQDFGPGITPDRMANVFIKYGNSTKRDEDKETGGFGLGAKSPFSYTDMFTVVSITPDESNPAMNIKREYIAYIDESRIGAMSLVKEEPCGEDTGTTIIVTAKEGDSYKFEQSVRQIGRYWKVKPVVEPYSGTFDWQSPEIKYEGDSHGMEQRWQITEESQDPVITVDRIPYELDKYALFGMNDRYGSPDAEWANAWKVLDAGFIIHLEISEGVVTANREKIEYTETVRTLVMNVLTNCTNAIERIASKDITDCKNIATAVTAFKKMRDKFPIEHIKWHGIDLAPFLSRAPSMMAYADVFRYEIDNDTDRPKRKRKLKSDYYHKHEKIPTDAATAIAEDDCGLNNPSIPRIASLLDMTDSAGNFLYNEVYVVRFKQKTVTATDGTVTLKSLKPTAQKELNWDDFNAIKLSDIPKKKRTITKKSKDGVPMTISPVKELDTGIGVRHWNPCDESLADGEGIYLVMKGGKTTFNGVTQDIEKLRALQAALPNDTICSVLERYVPKLGPKWKTVQAFLEEELNILMDEVVDYSHSDYYSFEKMRRVSKCLRHHLKELAFDSPLRRYIEVSIEISESRKKESRLQQVAKRLGRKIKRVKHHCDVRALHKAAKNRYPLLLELRDSYYEDNLNPAAKKDLIMYVNEKDAEAVRATWALVPVSNPSN